jgi:hypothetical protein
MRPPATRSPSSALPKRYPHKPPAGCSPFGHHGGIRRVGHNPPQRSEHLARNGKGNGNGNGGDAGAGEVQRNADDAADKGYVGSETDPTPNSAYTVTGQGEGTPETDAGAADAAADRSRELSGEGDNQ